MSFYTLVDFNNHVNTHTHLPNQGWLNAWTRSQMAGNLATWLSSKSLSGGGFRLWNLWGLIREVLSFSLGDKVGQISTVKWFVGSFGEEGKKGKRILRKLYQCNLSTKDVSTCSFLIAHQALIELKRKAIAKKKKLQTWVNLKPLKNTRNTNAQRKKAQSKTVPRRPYSWKSLTSIWKIQTLLTQVLNSGEKTATYLNNFQRPAR